MKFFATLKVAITAEARSIRIRRMCADCDLICDGKVDRCCHAPSVASVTTTGDIAATDNAHQLNIELATFTKIRVQVDRRHGRLTLL